MLADDDRSSDSKRLFLYVIGMAVIGIGSAIALLYVWFR